MDKLRYFVRGQAGAASIEYALLAGLIAMVIIGTATAIAGSLNVVLGLIAAELAAVAAAG